MKGSIFKTFFKEAAIILILAFATVQFFLILRHKSPYISDSYFYKHIYYQMKGETFYSAYQKVISQINLSNTDQIGANIFTNKNAYLNSYSFFTKRPLYPAMAYMLSLFIKREYLIFLIPVILGYLLTVLFVYYLSKEGLGYLFGILTTALFISFYPFLDWSTYFLTDTIGTSFWLIQTFFIYKFLTNGMTKWFLFYALLLSVSLLNREQNVLMVPLTALLFILLTIFRFPLDVKKRTIHLFFISLFVVFVYMVTSFILKQRTIVDTILYTQNNYGLFSQTYSFKETVSYILNSVKIAHIVFINELVRHHWWFTLTAISALGIIATLFAKKKRLQDMLLLTSGIASYLAIFIYPVLSYRYFFPVLLTIIYFSLKIIQDYFRQNAK